MKSLFKNYRHLTALALVIFVAVLGVALKVLNPCAALFIIGLWQLSQIATSKCSAGVFYMAGLSDSQVREFEKICDDLKELCGEDGKINQLEKMYDELYGQVRKMKKSGLGGVGHSGVRWVGNVPFVTDDCAQAITSNFVLQCATFGEEAMRMINPAAEKHKTLIAQARSFLGLPAETRAGGALSPTDIPLPTIYVPQIIELVFAYGQARQFATVFPLGAGTVKLPRLQAGEDDFGFLGAGTGGMSQNIPQKEVTAQLITFTANKFGGLIRIPTELEEDTFVPLGQFLARYIARQLAKGEDKTLFLADGTGTYANITGIAQYCVNNPQYLFKPNAGNTLVTDLTIANFRALRALVNPAILANMAANGQMTAAAYYMHPTLESLLVSFNTIGMPLIYRPAESGKPATLDGFPIRWVGVTAANNGNAQPNAFVAFFGDLSYWYLGERGSVRVEVSKEVFFQTDELAMRALERIDVEGMAVDAMATLQLPAA